MQRTLHHHGIMCCGAIHAAACGLLLPVVVLVVVALVLCQRLQRGHSLLPAAAMKRMLFCPAR